MKRLHAVGFLFVLITACGDAPALDGSQEASVLDGASDAASSSADAGDAGVCRDDDVSDLCFDVCTGWTECTTETMTECMSETGWCGARARARTRASNDAAWTCMMMHVTAGVVACVPYAGCWDAVGACL